MAPIHVQDELIDDSSSEIPVIGLKGSLSLKDRFISRLGRLLNAEVVAPEVEGSQTVSIYVMPSACFVKRDTVYDKRVRGFVNDIQRALRDVANATDGPPMDQALQDQWDVVLLYVAQNTDETIKKLYQIFEDYNNKFGALVSQMLGLDDIDESGSLLDTELGDLVIQLHQLAQGYGGSIKEQNDLIEFAWKLPHCCPALALGQPLRMHHTMIRAATTFEIFRTVKVYLGSPRPHCRLAVNLPAKCSLTKQHQPQSLQRYQSTLSTFNQAQPTRTFADIIRPYLAEEDSRLGIARLQPAQKQAVALLIGSILSDVPVPAGSEAYYQFGFVTCRNDFDERKLSCYYQKFLESTLDPTVVFKSVVKALEFGTLTGLLRNKGHQDLEMSFPSLQKFLNNPLEERPSIHRLVQFIRNKSSDEPVPCLRRDYGFRFCTQREHVTALKALYSMILDRAEAVKLHDACRSGWLREFAVEVLGHVDPTMRRFLQNDYPHPAIGFDNSTGIENYMKPLFKRNLGADPDLFGLDHLSARYSH
ncbi:uncharacterized protein EKO05_0008677 [Ascochyta rabiei]|uniref:uncharacterized protein n=1 Tax=Didymella rabiei TaxID=5454 RepID=UPI0021FD8304|nr:uncharacterized protein EKO05_0008677 [Ascochyta rabiei]UPX18375.1 hypothetical protein EKO05_0008677 [Ascochyta rabiei]